MPSALKLHLLDIEVGLISIGLWKDSNVLGLLEAFVNGEKDKDESRY
jgi:hypothetical protein